MWTSKMFLIDSGCLKAEQRSTAPPLYHIRGAAVVFFVEVIFGIDTKQPPVDHRQKACSCDRVFKE